MGPLIKITNVPIAYELKVNNARFEKQSGTAQLEMTSNNGGLRIESQNVRVNIDTFGSNNASQPAARTHKAAGQGKISSYQATASFSKEGKLIMDAKLNTNELNQIFNSNTQLTSGGTEPEHASSSDLNWSEPNISIEYEMEKLNFEFKLSNGDFEFIPGNIELNITQFPDVIIEYLGKPIYVPASSDPDYVEFSTKA